MTPSEPSGPDPSSPAGRGPLLNEVRDDVLHQDGLVGADLRTALTGAYDGWLAERLAPVEGLALVAVGGLGRREPAPYSDLDLVLLHDPKQVRPHELTTIADAIWYPVWDSRVGLDHSVRTVDQAVDVAKGDVKALLGMLDIRHVAGDPGMCGQVRERVLDLWRAGAVKRLDEVRAVSRERWDIAGEGAFLLEPNVKDSRGGLRDGQTLHALAMAQLVDYPLPAREAYALLLDVRGELQRRAGRADDVLHLQEHDGVAEALGMLDADGRPDRDGLLREVNAAARAISYAADVAIRHVDAARSTTRSPSFLRRFGIGNDGPQRTGLARGVVSQSGEVVLALDADPWADPALVVRAARAAAEHDLPLSPFALERLATESAPMPEPWPAGVRTDFVALLGTGRAAVPVIESLDQAGLLEKLIPEWAAVRSKPQHNPVHRFTVDRHLLEAAARTVPLLRQVERPDLLLVGALLHDIGKGYPGDHSVVGAVHARTIAERMGFTGDDVGVIVALVRHHLLLPDTATRRDPTDEVTIRTVTDVVGDSGELLALLHALTVADAGATGPAAWSDWKARLVSDLVHRVRAVMHGGHLPDEQPLDDERRRLAEAGELAVRFQGDEVIVAAPDAFGTLYRTAGVLALHSLDIKAASIATHAGMAVNVFLVEPRFGSLPDPAIVRGDLARAMDGVLGLADRLSEKERAYARGASRERQPPTVVWFDDAATDATVLEFRGDDAIGLLFRVTSALERSGLDVRGARLSSLGGSVVDAFYLTTREGAPVPADLRAAVGAELTALAS